MSGVQKTFFAFSWRTGGEVKGFIAHRGIKGLSVTGTRQHHLYAGADGLLTSWLQEER